MTTLSKIVASLALCLLGAPGKTALGAPPAALTPDSSSILRSLETAVTSESSTDGLQIQCDVVDKEFPKAAPPELKAELERGESSVRANAGDSELDAKLAAADFNINFKLNNCVIQRSRLIASTRSPQWSLEWNILSREDTQHVSDDLKANPYIQPFRLDFNRSRTFAWDGHFQRVIFNSDDRFIRSGQIYPNEEKLDYMQTIARLGRVPSNMMGALRTSGTLLRVTADTAEAYEVSADNTDRTWHAVVDISPRYGNECRHVELWRGTVHYACDSTDLKLVQGRWLPFHVLEESSRTIDGVPTPVRSCDWTVVSISPLSDDTPALFSPAMPANGVITDYRFTPAVTYRSDESLVVDEREIKALAGVVTPNSGPPIATDLTVAPKNQAGIADGSAKQTGVPPIGNLPAASQLSDYRIAAVAGGGICVGLSIWLLSLKGRSNG